MSSSSTVRVPEGMSCVNAFHALWACSRPVSFFADHPEMAKDQAQSVSTPEKVAKLFEAHTYFCCAGGRALKVEFSQFPELKVYDTVFCQDAARKALEEYMEIPSNQRFDANDTYKFGVLRK